MNIKFGIEPGFVAIFGGKNPRTPLCLAKAGRLSRS